MECARMKTVEEGGKKEQATDTAQLQAVRPVVVSMAPAYYDDSQHTRLSQAR